MPIARALIVSQGAATRNRRSSHIRWEAIHDHNLGTPHLKGIGLARRRHGGDPDTDKEGVPMSDRSFHRNDWPTLGVELELQLVDAESMALKSASADVLAHLPGDLRGHERAIGMPYPQTAHLAGDPRSLPRFTPGMPISASPWHGRARPVSRDGRS